MPLSRSNTKALQALGPGSRTIVQSGLSRGVRALPECPGQLDPKELPHSPGFAAGESSCGRAPGALMTMSRVTGITAAWYRNH